MKQKGEQQQDGKRTIEITTGKERSWENPEEEREPQKEEEKQNKRRRESQPATKRGRETARKTHLSRG